MIHDQAFVSAGAKGALLQDLRVEVEKAIINGQDRSQFQKEFNEIVKRRGWDVKGGNDWRAGIIYQTNLRQAYGDGRCRQMSDPDVQSQRPYRMWVHGNSAEPRPTHIAMNGKVFRADHPVANQILPNGFGCRCTWVTLSDRDLKRRGLQVTTDLNWGDLIPTAKGDQPLEIDKGFKKPCKFESEREREERKSKARQEILDRLPPDIRRDAIREIAALLAPLGFVTDALAIGLLPIPLGVLDEANRSVGLSRKNYLQAIIKPATVTASVPLALYGSGLGVSEVSKAWRGSIQNAIAEQIKKEISEQDLQRVRDLLASQVKDNPITFVMSGEGDSKAEAAKIIAKGLAKEGLIGEIIPAINPINRGEIDSASEFLRSLFTVSLGLSAEYSKSLIAFILDRQANKVNLVGHSAGAVVMEDVVGVLAALNIPVSDVITLGGVTTPTRSLPQTNYRRYLSDVDQYQILNKIPNLGSSDRYYKGVYHGLPQAEQFGRKGIFKTWLANKEVMQDMVKDLNDGVKIKLPELAEPQKEFVKIPDVTKTIPADVREIPDTTPTQTIKTPEIREQPKIIPKPPETRLITQEELNGLREAAKRELDFTIRINKNRDGRFNVQPTKKDGYQWNAEKAQKVADFLKKNGIPLDGFDPNNPAWQEGMNYLKVETNPDAPLSTQPAGNLAPAIPNRFRARANSLERAAETTRERLSSLTAEKDIILERLSSRIEEDNPLFKEVQGKYNRQLGIVKKQVDQQQRRGRALALDAEKLENLPVTENTKSVRDALNNLAVADLELNTLKTLQQDIRLNQELIASITLEVNKSEGAKKTELNKTLKQFVQRGKIYDKAISEINKSEVLSRIRRLESIIKRGLQDG